MAALAATIPLIGWVHNTYGFDMMFYLLTIDALLILAAVIMLPRAMHAPAEQVAPAE